MACSPLRQYDSAIETSGPSSEPGAAESSKRLSARAEVLRLDRSRFDAIDNKAALLCYRQKFEQALATFNACLERSPDDVRALCNRARIRLMFCDLSGAERDFRVALTLDPEDETALAHLALIRKLHQIQGT